MINAKRLHEILVDCFYRDEELDESQQKVKEGQPEPVIVEGIMTKFRFHPERLNSHRDEITEMLKQLPDEFHKNGGGGMTFLNACMTKDGKHWGEHPSMEKLFALGMGMGMVSYPMPKDTWDILPGHMPYVCIDTNANR